jgi:hypothetical protein
MADKKISQLTAATTPLAGTEVLPIVQSGSTVKATVANVQEAPVASGTANGLVYLNASKVPTTGSALTFNGTEVSSTGAIRTSDEFSALGGRLTLYRSAGASYIDWASAQNLNWRTVTSVGGGGANTLMTLGSTGDLTVSTGNLVVGTAAKGIDFSANTGAAGETSSLLNWYEEGTFTPQIADANTGGNAATFSGNAHYTRVGRVVTITFAADSIDTTGMTAGNTLYFRNFPFTIKSATTPVGAFYSYRVGGGSGQSASVLGIGGATYAAIYIYTGNSATADTTLKVSDLVSGTSSIYFSLTYFV